MIIQSLPRLHHSLLAAVLLLSGSAQAAPESPGVLARIALVSDTHSNRGTNDQQPRYHARLDKVIAAVNAAKVDCVLLAGDLTENGKPEEIADFRNQIRGFQAPAWLVPGNHDVGNKRIKGKEKESSLNEWRVTRFEMRCGSSFFVHQRAGLRVIGFNSPILGSGYPREARMWRFLEKELAKPNPLPTVVFTHYPPFLKTPTEGTDYFNIEPEPRARLLKLLRQGNVRAVLSGHLHRSLTNHNDGISFLTTGPVSLGLPQGKQAQGWTLVTVPRQGEVRGEFQPIKD
jgi:3',5'-cyclic AMP phosphodiesterase CpdA